MQARNPNLYPEVLGDIVDLICMLRGRSGNPGPLWETATSTCDAMLEFAHSAGPPHGGVLADWVELHLRSRVQALRISQQLGSHSQKPETAETDELGGDYSLRRRQRLATLALPPLVLLAVAAADRSGRLEMVAPQLLLLGVLSTASLLCGRQRVPAWLSLVRGINHSLLDMNSPKSLQLLPLPQAVVVLGRLAVLWGSASSLAASCRSMQALSPRGRGTVLGGAFLHPVLAHFALRLPRRLHCLQAVLDASTLALVALHSPNCKHLLPCVPAFVLFGATVSSLWTYANL